MRIVVLTTGTNNVLPIVGGLPALGHRVKTIIYDEMTHAEHARLPLLCAAHKPDWVLYVGALAEHHGKPVPTTDVLAAIAARFPLVHLCFDGAEPVWWQRLQEYYDHGRFALQVNIDGTRTGPIGDRGLTLLPPVDITQYSSPAHATRSIPCGFSGGLHAGREDIIGPLVQRWLLSFRERDTVAGHELYRAFLAQCRTGVNDARTGGMTGRLHVKYRASELAAAGCLVLETRGSPLADWFTPGEDYLEYDGVEEAASLIIWAKQNVAAAEAMAAKARAKVAERQRPEVFWSQVEERLGFGPALQPAPEAPWKFWVMPGHEAPQPVLPLVNGHDPGEPVFDGNQPAEPVLIGNKNEVNFVAFAGRVYSVPRFLGPLDLTDEQQRLRPEIRRFTTLHEAHRAYA